MRLTFEPSDIEEVERLYKLRDKVKTIDLSSEGLHHLLFTMGYTIVDYPKHEGISALCCPITYNITGIIVKKIGCMPYWISSCETGEEVDNV